MLKTIGGWGLALAWVIGSGAVMAQAAPPAGGHGAKFEQHKQKALARIAKRMEILQTLQSCVQAASDRAALKACHETAKAARQAEKHS